jgi:hypothetical protein
MMGSVVCLRGGLGLCRLRRLCLAMVRVIVSRRGRCTVARGCLHVVPASSLRPRRVRLERPRDHCLDAWLGLG